MIFPALGAHLALCSGQWEGPFLCSPALVAVPGPVPTGSAQPLPPLRLLTPTPLPAAGSSWIWGCGGARLGVLVAAGEAQAQALGGGAEIKGFALLADGLSGVRAQMATQCPTCSPGNIKDLVPCLHIDTSLNYSGVTGFGSWKGQPLTGVLPPTQSWAGLYFPTQAVPPALLLV